MNKDTFAFNLRMFAVTWDCGNKFCYIYCSGQSTPTNVCMTLRSCGLPYVVQCENIIALNHEPMHYFNMLRPHSLTEHSCSQRQEYLQKQIHTRADREWVREKGRVKYERHVHILPLTCNGNWQLAICIWRRCIC